MVEESLGRAFAGIEQPEQGGAIQVPGGGRAGFFPRSFLLGNAPELSEIEVFRARLDQPPPPGWHWRGITYDLYRGSGWARSDEERAVIQPADALAWTPIANSFKVEQEVTWTENAPPNVAFVIGRPLSFDQPVTVNFRTAVDLAFVNEIQATYAVVSEVPLATESELRQLDMADVPAAIMERYTALPETVPQRVHELAADVIAGSDNAYDQARALESFLRQYPYSLEAATLPPAGRDPVDYFLFELKQGYCDYYASSMVVMARSIGLPARFASGFTLQVPDASGIQTVFQINAHSWAEIYFPGFGWLEFEPTAGFAANISTTQANGGFQAPDDAFGLPGAFEGGVPPIPPDEMAEPISGLWFVGGALLIVLLAGAGWFAWQWQPDDIDGYSYGYDRLRQHWAELQSWSDPALTPLEFRRQIQGSLQALEDETGEPAGWWQRRVLTQRTRLTNLVDRYNLNQYSPAPPADSQDGFMAWRQIRQPLWIWRTIHRLTRR